MGRILFWVLLAVAAWIGWRLWKNNRRLQSKHDAASAKQVVEGEVLVPCSRCGVRLPRSAAIADGGAYYCSTQHRDEHNASA
jgi:hypothetical protein